MNTSTPRIFHPDQSLVELYDELWALCDQSWFSNKRTLGENSVLVHESDSTINQFDTIMSTFFMVYCDAPVTQQLDFFYARQEKSGAIRSDYNTQNGHVAKVHGNRLGIGAPLFSWAEYNLYHKLDNKKRIAAVVPILEKYWNWLDRVALSDNGLYSVPLVATGMRNSPRDKMKYPIDFNLQQAINANCMAQLGSIINDKEVAFRYRKKYFILRSQINSLMWDQEKQFYFDLDEHGKYIRVKSVAAFWALLAQILNEAKLDALVANLEDPKEFSQLNVFPTLSKSERKYSPNGEGYRGSVFPPYTYMIIKGLEKYSAFRAAKKYALRHIKAIIETHKKQQEESDDTNGGFCEAYKPESNACAVWGGKRHFPRQKYTPYLGLSGIALMIENVIGLKFSMPKKTVDLTLTNMEAIGIENISLKRNSISIICEKTHRGWEIHLSSEKLYYFTVNVLNKKKKTLPIPSGKCSLLIGKL